MGDVSIFDLRCCMSFDGIPDCLHTLLALDADVREVLLTQLEHVHADAVAAELRATLFRSIKGRAMFSFNLFNDICRTILLQSILHFEIGDACSIE